MQGLAVAIECWLFWFRWCVALFTLVLGNGTEKTDLGGTLMTPIQVETESTEIDGFFEAVISDKSGYAALPHHSIDPIFAASTMIVCFQHLVSREVGPLDSQLVTVAKFQGGDSFNVIPDSVIIGGAFHVSAIEVCMLVKLALGVSVSKGYQLSTNGYCDFLQWTQNHILNCQSWVQNDTAELSNLVFDIWVTLSSDVLVISSYWERYLPVGVHSSIETGPHSEFYLVLAGFFYEFHQHQQYNRHLSSKEKYMGQASRVVLVVKTCCTPQRDMLWKSAWDIRMKLRHMQTTLVEAYIVCAGSSIVCQGGALIGKPCHLDTFVSMSYNAQVLWRIAWVSTSLGQNFRFFLQGQGRKVRASFAVVDSQLAILVHCHIHILFLLSQGGYSDCLRSVVLGATVFTVISQCPGVISLQFGTNNGKEHQFSSMMVPPLQVIVSVLSGVAGYQVLETVPQYAKVYSAKLDRGTNNILGLATNIFTLVLPSHILVIAESQFVFLCVLLLLSDLTFVDRLWQIAWAETYHFVGGTFTVAEPDYAISVIWFVVPQRGGTRRRVMSASDDLSLKLHVYHAIIPNSMCYKRVWGALSPLIVDP